MRSRAGRSPGAPWLLGERRKFRFRFALRSALLLCCWTASSSPDRSFGDAAVVGRVPREGAIVIYFLSRNLDVSLSARSIFGHGGCSHGNMKTVKENQTG